MENCTSCSSRAKVEANERLIYLEDALGEMAKWTQSGMLSSTVAVPLWETINAAKVECARLSTILKA